MQQAPTRYCQWFIIDMSVNERLAGHRILLTRPDHKIESLANYVISQGATPVKLPTIDVVPITQSDREYQELKQQMMNIDLFDIIICISANAANFALQWLDEYWPQLPIGIKWFAIGKATATRLSMFDITATTAASGHDSEALLATIELQNITGKKILILKGNAGREMLSKTLEKRGATVTDAILYKRLIPKYSSEELNSTLYSRPLSAILTTSAEAVSNLVSLALGNDRKFDISVLLNTRLIVPSPRVAKAASIQGFQRITVANGPDDVSMVTALHLVNDSEANK